jgi:hypothetical protein
MAHRFKEKKIRSVSDIEADMNYWLKQSHACKYCADECWCDGDWSPAAHLSSLRKELRDVKRGKVAA